MDRGLLGLCSYCGSMRYIGDTFCFDSCPLFKQPWHVLSVCSGWIELNHCCPIGKLKWKMQRSKGDKLWRWVTAEDEGWDQDRWRQNKAVVWAGQQKRLQKYPQCDTVLHYYRTMSWIAFHKHTHTHVCVSILVGIYDRFTWCVTLTLPLRQ